MTKTSPPKEIFVVSIKDVQREWEPENGDWVLKNETTHNFGFLHPHEPNKKNDGARKATQYEWAYRGMPKQTEDGHFWQYVREKYDHEKGCWVYENRPIEPEQEPRVWDNVPLAGFKIIDTVNRYRGNKLYKVMDPRGVVFEVTIKSMFEIFMNSTVIRGEIMHPCLWKANKNLVLA
jgi:hypothetical protein